MTTAKIRFLTIFCSLVFSTAIAQAAWVFTSPAQGTEYTTTANISAGGSGAASTSWTLECKNNGGTVEQTTSGTSGAGMGYWSGTLDAPSGGWSRDIQGGSVHTLKITGGDGLSTTRTVKVP